MKTEKILFMPGNIIHVGLRVGCPDYGSLILPVLEMANEDRGFFMVPYTDTDMFEPEYHGGDEVEGIPLTFTPLLNLFNITLPEDLPPHIEYFHELQNWYYYTQGKHLIDLETFDDYDGNAWIDISKQFFALVE